MSSRSGEVFSNKLRETRIAKGFTQESLAKKLGIGGTAVANYESGKNGPRPQVLMRLSEVLDVPADYLTGREGEDPPVLEQSEEMEFHPKIEKALQAIMEEEGFKTREECIASLIRDRAAGLTPTPPPPKKPQSIGDQIEAELGADMKTMEEDLKKAFGDRDKGGD